MKISLEIRTWKSLPFPCYRLKTQLCFHPVMSGQKYLYFTTKQMFICSFVKFGRLLSVEAESTDSQWTNGTRLMNVMLHSPDYWSHGFTCTHNFLRGMGCLWLTVLFRGLAVQFLFAKVSSGKILPSQDVFIRVWMWVWVGEWDMKLFVWSRRVLHKNQSIKSI